VPRDANALAAAAPGAHAAPANVPWFEIPVIDGPHAPALGVTPAPLAYHGCTENLVASILWENPENGADVAHLPVLHAEFIIPALYPLLSHKWSATWAVRERAPHLADIMVKEGIVLGRLVDLPGEVDVKITQCGPSQVFIDLATPVGRVLVVETVTPVAPRLQRVLHAAYAAPAVPRAFAKAILYSVMVQYEKDVPVWNNKVYAPRPQLAKHDPSVGAYRRWAKRFIPPGAVTFRDAVRAHAADALGLPAESGLAW